MIEFQIFQMYHLKEMTLLAEFFLSCSILQLTFYAIGTAYNRKNGYTILSRQIFLLGFLIIFFTTLLLINETLYATNVSISNHAIINDYLSFGTKLLICLISGIFLLMIKLSYKDELISSNFEYLTLILISILGLMLLCSSNDLITAYLTLELHSIAFYVMAAFKKDSTYSIESGLKYFIIGSLSSAFFLLGSSIIYGTLGSINFDDFRLLINNSKTIFSAPALLSSSIFVNKLLFSSEFDFVSKKIVFNNFVNRVSSYELTVNDRSELEISQDYSAFMEAESFNYNNVTLSSSCNELSSWSLTPRLSLDNYPNDKFLFYDIVSTSHFSEELPLTNCYKEFVEFDVVSLGLLFIFIAIFIKLALAPFHLWSLDVYEGSPNSTTAFFAVIPKLALFVLLARLCYSSFYDIIPSSYQNYFIILAFLSILTGSIGGLEQRRVKTLMAYSSVSHTGYLFFAFSSHSVESVQIVLYYLIIFMISGLCFWGAYLFMKQKSTSYVKKNNKELGDFILLKESNAVLALIFATTLFSIAGIPPLVGFLAKINIFLATIQSSFYLVSIFAILLSIASTFYYIRFIKLLYFENVLVGKLYHPITTQKSIFLIALTFLLISLCLDPKLLYLLSYKAVLILAY